MLFNIKEQEQEKEPETTQAEVMQNPETMTQTAESIEDKYKVFDTMSEDWGVNGAGCTCSVQLREKGAREHLWSNGVYVYSYNTAIMQRMKEIEEVVGE